MAGELQEGEWAIWGALAKQRLQTTHKLDINSYAEHIRRCAWIRSLQDGRKLHSELRSAGMDEHRYLGNLLVQMYGNCKSVTEAKTVFDNIRDRNVFSWNIMLVAFTQNGHLQQAKELFERTPASNVVTWNTIHASYAQGGDLHEAKRLFEGIPERDPVSWNTMIVMYAKKGHLLESKEMFEQMPMRNVVSWNSLIAAYAIVLDMTQARTLLELMPYHNVVSWNTVLSGYVEMENMVEAGKLFELMPERDAVSWTALITGYAQIMEMERARFTFERMPLKDLVSWTAMITANARNGHLREARALLDGLHCYDSGCWNAMITGYVENGRGKEALHIFRLMDLEGVCIDKVAFFNALDAAICMANLSEGRAVHALAKESGFMLNVQVNNSLINMYGKCGSLESARGVFDVMHERNTVTWNAIMTCYTKNGDFTTAFDLFQMMILDGMPPDGVAFVTALSGCSHGGMLRNGYEWFISLQEDFEERPNADHYAIMVDLLGRVGQLSRAEELIDSMPYEPQVLAWRSLLAACKVHGDSSRGMRLAKDLMQQAGDRDGPGSTYVLVCNMFSDPGDDVDGGGTGNADEYHLGLGRASGGGRWQRCQGKTKKNTTA